MRRRPAPELLCRLLDLPAERVVAIAAQLAEDDELAAALTSSLYCACL
jgi:hypothetical protein